MESLARRFLTLGQEHGVLNGDDVMGDDNFLVCEGHSQRRVILVVVVLL
jgi:hypothetical protein